MKFAIPRHIRKNASLTLAVACLFTGCAVAPEIWVNTQQIDSARERSVAVLPSTAMNNSANATRLAQLLSDELIARGYKVEKSTAEAKLIVIASFSRVGSPIYPSSTSTLPLVNFAGPTPLNFDTPGMIQSRLHGLENDLRLPTPSQKAGLIVTAILTKDWQNPNKDTPKVAWRTIAIMSQYEGQENIVPKLMKAAGAQFP